MDYIDCEFDGVKLQVYSCGKVERFTKKYGWRSVGTVAKTRENYSYICVRINSKLYPIHRIIYHAYCNEEFDIDNYKQQIDHINGNPLDNRIENLRVVSNQQNQWNRVKAKGCVYDKNCKNWYSQICINRKRICLGRFANEDEAHNAYLIAKKKYHIITSAPSIVA